MTPHEQLLKPEVINALGPYFWALVFLVVVFLGAAAAALRALGKMQRDWQSFIGNHMTENASINQSIEASLRAVAERLSAVETRVSECPRRAGGSAEASARGREP